MKNLSLLIVLILFSCAKNQETVTKPRKKGSIQNNVNSFAVNSNFEVNPKTIFGVYQLTPKDFAIVIPVQFDNPELPLSKEYEEFLIKDSLPWIYNKPMGDYKYYDTIHQTTLFYNKRFEQEFKAKMKEQYFVYGTKGVQECRITKVLFESTECGSDFIAYCLNVDFNKIGNPLIASENSLPFEQQPNISKELTSKIVNFSKKEATEENYGLKNVYKPKVFGKINQYYFTYHDDFKWYYKKGESSVQFPERAVFKINEEGSVKYIWSSEIDLLGLPCL